MNLCQPLNFKGTEGVVGLSQWLEKMESVFHISGCAVENQVKFATCTLLGVALTWWNGHVRTLGHDAAYAMTWEMNLGDPIDIRVDIVHPAPVDVFPAATVVRILAQHGEAIRGIHGHLQGVPINEEMSALRFRMRMVKEENASLRGKIKTMEATDTITRRQEKRARMKLERQLASVQES
ncbi:hypothetical protein Tco_0735989 [Tanacetum coccineum]